MACDPEGSAVLTVVLVTSMPVVIATLLEHRQFGGGPSLCLLAAMATLLSLVRSWSHGISRYSTRGARLPQARVQRSRRRRSSRL